MPRLFNWHLLPHSKPVIVQEGLRAPTYQIVVPGMGVAFVKATDNGQLHIKCQEGLVMAVTGNPTDGLVIKFEKETWGQ